MSLAPIPGNGGRHRSICGASIAILLSEHLRQYDPVRRGESNFLGQLAKRIFQKAFPTESEVRGNIVAADVLVDALLNHGAANHYEFFVYPWGKAAASEKLSLNTNVGRRVKVTSLQDLRDTNLNHYNFKAWFNPLPTFSTSASGMELPYRIRSNFSSSVYPIVTLLHGLSTHSMLYYFFLRLLLESTCPADSLVCTSRASRQATQNILSHVGEEFNRHCGAQIGYKGRTDIIPLCVDTERFRPGEKEKLRKKTKLANNAFIILYLGKLTPLKADLLPFLPVLKALIDRNPNQEILWVLAGTEEIGYSKTVLDYARSVGVADHIRMILNLTDEMKAMLLPAVDVLLSPSDSVQESFGLTPVEAMACGVPQVVADWDGYRDTVTHGETGFLVPTYWMHCQDELCGTGLLSGWQFDHARLGHSIAVDLDKTREYLQTLIESIELRCEMGRHSRARALALYSMESVAKQYEELWAELAGIADVIRPQYKPTRFDQPLYYDFFGHYASSIVDDESLIEITPLGKHVACQHNEIAIPNPVELFSNLDSLIIHQLIETLAGPSGFNTKQATLQTAGALPASSQIEVSELVQNLVRTGGHQSDHVKRHIMWLVKYGYAKPLRKAVEETA